MSHPRKRRWFRISLKSLLGISILSGVFVAWVSNSYKQYQFEQELIETVASDMPRSSMMNLSVNGQHMSPFNAMWSPNIATVVVNYQGPKITQRLFESMGIPIFNRIEEVDFLIGDVGEVPLDKKDLHKLPHLEKFSVMQKGRKKLTESDSQSIESKVRKCRVGAIEKTDKQVSIQLNGKSPFMCAE